MEKDKAEAYSRLLYAIFGEKFDFENTPTASTELVDQLNAVLGTLTVREDDFIRRRFGIENGHPQYISDLALLFELNENETKELEAETMRKLRHPSRSQPLREFLD